MNRLYSLSKIKKYIGFLAEREAKQKYSKIDYMQKRALDYSMALSLSICLSPIILYTIYRIKKESPGKILFKQTRVGLNGEKFTCYKFRSMHENAHFNPYTEENDNRIFPYGRFMRKTRIDELAQLINIIKGDMHIVGPRAEWDILVNKYEKVIPNYHLRHRVKPGITGLAQVRYPYGRNSYDARRKLTYDMLYINKWSILLDFKILLQTIGVVLGRKGV